MEISNLFFNNIEDNNFIVFHTKIRLTSQYDYNSIKHQLKQVVTNYLLLLPRLTARAAPAHVSRRGDPSSGAASRRGCAIC